VTTALVALGSLLIGALLGAGALITIAIVAIIAHDPGER
jgi:hypothetical protein